MAETQMRHNAFVNKVTKASHRNTEFARRLLIIQ